MKKKMITTIIVGMFLLTAFATLPTMGLEASVEKEKSNDIVIGVSSVENKCAYSGEDWNSVWGPDVYLPEIEVSGMSSVYITYKVKYEISEKSSPFTGGAGLMLGDSPSSYRGYGPTYRGYQPDWSEERVNFNVGGLPGSMLKLIIKYDSAHALNHALGFYFDDIVIMGDGEILYSNDFEDYEIGESFGDYFIIEDPISFPPHKPVVDGKTNANLGATYRYNVSTNEPDGEQIYYKFNWGDGTESEWIGPYNSGDVVSIPKVWTIKGKYEVKVKAKDSNDVESMWSNPLVVNMPKGKIKAINPLIRLLENMLDQFDFLLPIFSRILE